MAADEAFFKCCLIIFSLFSPISSLSSTASYGRHRRPTTTGRTIPAPIAWFLFESPTLWLTILLFPLGKNHSNPKSIIHISFYLIHYFHRVLIYPLVMFLIINRKNPKSGGHDYPIKETVLGTIYNLLNAYLQARSASEYTDFGNDKLFRFRFLFGTAIFAAGMAINVSSDYALLKLKSDQTTASGEGDKGIVKNRYKIPKGGMFELVSCPNYFGEIMEFFGWALVTCRWAPFIFFLNTCSILIPRAFAHHKWYLDKFGEKYPKNRKAVIPFLC